MTHQNAPQPPRFNGINPLQRERDETPVSLFNPLKNDLVSLLRDDSNTQVEYRIPSMEIASFPAYIASRLKTDLTTMIRNERGVDNSDPEGQTREIEEEITIHEK